MESDYRLSKVSRPQQMINRILGDEISFGVAERKSLTREEGSRKTEQSSRLTIIQVTSWKIDKLRNMIIKRFPLAKFIQINSHKNCLCSLRCSCFSIIGTEAILHRAWLFCFFTLFLCVSVSRNWFLFVPLAKTPNKIHFESFWTNEMNCIVNVSGNQRENQFELIECIKCKRQVRSESFWGLQSFQIYFDFHTKATTKLPYGTSKWAAWTI